MIHDEALKGFGVGGSNYLGRDLFCGAILGTHNRRLANRPAPGILQGLALRVAHVPTLPTEIGLIDFYRTRETAVRVGSPRLTNPMQHEPGGRLRNTNVPAQLHAAHTFQAGQAQVDGDGPLAKRDVRSGNRRFRFGR